MTTLDHSSKAPDPTAGTLVSTIWTTIEASSAVVCACLPMVRTPVQRLVPRLFPSHAASGTGKEIKGKPAPVVGNGGQLVPGTGAESTGEEVAKSEDDSATWTNTNGNGSQSRDGDLEMGGLGHGMRESQSWPRRSSSSKGGQGLALGSQLPKLGLGHKRLLSESSGYASPTKL